MVHLNSVCCTYLDNHVSSNALKCKEEMCLLKDVYNSPNMYFKNHNVTHF